MTGADLQALRRATGISKTDMGALIDCTQYSIDCWEAKCQLSSDAVYCGIPAKMLQAMGQPLPHYRTTTRPSGDGVLPRRDTESATLNRHDACIAKWTAHYKAT